MSIRFRQKALHFFALLTSGIVALVGGVSMVSSVFIFTYLVLKAAIRPQFMNSIGTDYELALMIGMMLFGVFCFLTHFVMSLLTSINSHLLELRLVAQEVDAEIENTSGSTKTKSVRVEPEITR